MRPGKSSTTSTARASSSSHAAVERVKQDEASFSTVHAAANNRLTRPVPMGFYTESGFAMGDGAYGAGRTGRNVSDNMTPTQQAQYAEGAGMHRGEQLGMTVTAGAMMVSVPVLGTAAGYLSNVAEIGPIAEALMLSSPMVGETIAVLGAAATGARIFRSGLSFFEKGEAGKIINLRHTLEEAEYLVPSGSVGSVRVWTTKARIKTANLPNEGKIRFVPDKDYHPSEPLLRGPNNGYLDKFGNEWTKGPSRTPGQPFEWDVQLSNVGKKQLGWASRDGNHINISLDGKITHR